MNVKRNYKVGQIVTIQSSRVIPESREASLIVHLKCTNLMNIEDEELYGVKRDHERL